MARVKRVCELCQRRRSVARFCATCRRRRGDDVRAMLDAQRAGESARRIRLLLDGALK